MEPSTWTTGSETGAPGAANRCIVRAATTFRFSIGMVRR
jgi:hypothetical protein